MTTFSLVETKSDRSRHVLFITMSQKELHRLEVIQKVRDERLSVVQAAGLLDLSRSQVHRLLQAYDRDGPAGLVSKKRSRPSNRRHSEEFRNATLDLIREHYLDFGPTLAREKLIELHGILILCRATIRIFTSFAPTLIPRHANAALPVIKRGFMMACDDQTLAKIGQMESDQALDFVLAQTAVARKQIEADAEGEE
jgi:hypothetical protein